MVGRDVVITLLPSMSKGSFLNIPERVEITALKDNLRVNREILGLITDIRFVDGNCVGLLELIADLPITHADEFNIVPYGSGVINPDGSISNYKIHGFNFSKKR